MSASACVFIVSALPWALSILNWSADSPAASNACVRYGASYVTYRADVVVSGRRTPIMPVPCAARSVSCFIAEKSAVKSSTAICGTGAVEVDVDPLGEVPESDDLEHAANVAASKQAADSATRYLLELMDPPIKSLVSIQRCWFDLHSP